MLLTQNNDFLLLCISLHRITFLSFEEKKILLKKLDSSYSLALLSIEEIEKIIHRKIFRHKDWNGSENLRRAKIALHYCFTLNVKIIFYEDEEYPELLKQISDPPLLLYCRGNEKILCDKSVSVVGTRRLTQMGKLAAKQFAFDAVIHGENVVSGLANGADGFAHQGALDAYFEALDKQENMDLLGRTVGVLPTAIDEIYPVSHKKMAVQIIQTGGCLISEYEPGMEMANWHFVGRNRIIAGLSPATVVIEAPPGSGALITAEFALEYDRDLMFHQVTFQDNAKAVAEIISRSLEMEHASGKVSKHKIENRPEKFLEAGAPVIKDYKEYCETLGSIPGTFTKLIQGTLF